VRNATLALAQIVLRDGAVCYICKQTEDAEDPWEIEHVKPKMAFRGTSGDPDDIANLKLAHRSCNRLKGINAVIADG